MGQQESEPYPTTIVWEDEGKPNESPILRNSRTVTENGGQLISTFRSQPESDTMVKILRSTTVKYGERDALGEREDLGDGKWGKYFWINYNQFEGKVKSFSRGLQELGLGPGDKIGIYSHNCPYWQIACFGAQYSSMIAVPVYDSLGPDAAHFIITHAECKAVVVHKVKLQNLLAILDRCELLKYIIVIDNEPPNVSSYQDKESFTCDEIVEKGTNSNKELIEPKPEDTAVIMYTSGSTGKPKGCILTHRNIVAGATGLASLGCSITKIDTFMSFLPLAHIYEMGVETIFIAQGARIGFSTGNIKNLTNDFQALQPTIITGVPRVWNRIVDTMKKKIADLPAPKRALVNWAIKMKAKAVAERRKPSLILDQLVFKDFVAALGGRVRFIVSGGAPILPDVYEFLSSTITPNIVQGYGLTEVCAGLAVQEIPAWTSSDTGCVSITSECKLRAVDGLLYDPRGTPMCGELLVRGPHVFKGYYKDEKQTEEAMVDGEWFATGDIVQLTSHGVIQIIDRAKQLVKLSQGEYLAITTLNDTYSHAKDVANIYIYADSHHDFPAAVVVPVPSVIEKWKALGITDPTNSKQAIDEMLQNLNECHKEQHLRGFERLKTIIIETEDFTIENGLLTPSMKPQWTSLRKKYECQLLDAMEKAQK